MSHQRVQELNSTFTEVLRLCPELVFIGDKVLREKTIDISLDEGLAIGSQLKDVLKKYREIAGFGRGLAAPQIGIGKSVFVTFVNDQFKIYINPVVSNPSTKHSLYRESCLSCGYLSVDVRRSESIEISYLNEEGVQMSEPAGGFLARLLQHEYDHLQGVVNVDCAEPQSIEFMVNDPLQEKLRECL